MSGVQKQVERFKALGFSARDVRHIAVYVDPSITEIDGQLVQTHTAYVGERDGNFFIDFPTDMIFVVMTDGWEFERFELGGKTWDGIAVMPEDSDFEVSFGDEGRQSVVVFDKCQCFFTYRYQIVLRNQQTGERVVVDPGVGNGDRPDPPPAP
jgi:hypothetical protein